VSASRTSAALGFPSDGNQVAVRSAVNGLIQTARVDREMRVGNAIFTKKKPGAHDSDLGFP
jgi:hypothetical protein